eukprot:TRINITY_DN93174_c0_g1_i1.p1 TRINITY_DN93174_c0_g1~~TRINITY_DN93174_c0_g1_i1.p1  ORF type:complete len:275 (-),score=90.83 TRINITY_DN93174_c0_g1_i1:184-1008(-)
MRFFIFALALSTAVSLDVRRTYEPPLQSSDDEDVLLKATREAEDRLVAKGFSLAAIKVKEQEAQAPPPPAAAAVVAASPAAVGAASPSPAAGPAPAAFENPTVMVTDATCQATAKNTKAMSCSLVTQISGKPEGCECRLRASTCPPADKTLGFTGMSPGNPIEVPQTGEFVILCMYWQWFKPIDHSAEVVKRKEETKALASTYLRQGFEMVQNAVQPVAAVLATVTTTPPPLVSPADIEAAVKEALSDFTRAPGPAAASPAAAEAASPAALSEV